MKKDYGLENLLELDGVVMVLNEAGYWVKFDVRQTMVTVERPHGIAYSLTLHDPGNERILGFDNAHAIRKTKGRSGRVTGAYDHKHLFETLKSYPYEDALKLLDDFCAAVDAVLEGGGS